MNAESLESALRQRLGGRVVVMGIGNPQRGDDAAGNEVAKHLRSLLQDGGLAELTVVEAEEVPECYLAPVRDAAPDVVVMVDAVDMHASPGEVELLEGDALRRATPITHRTPLPQLASCLERVAGARVCLLAIQPSFVDWGMHMTPAVQAAALQTAAVLASAVQGSAMSSVVAAEAVAC